MDTETDRWVETETDRWMELETDIQMDNRTDKQMLWMYGQIRGNRDRQMDSTTDVQLSGQEDRQTDGWTDEHKVLAGHNIDIPNVKINISRAQCYKPIFELYMFTASARILLLKIFPSQSNICR